jgi:two-component system, OmpR family, sensor histidine kinase SenX3
VKSETQRQQFYRLMLDDTDRLRSTVEQVLKAGEVRYRRTAARNPVEVDFPGIVGECMDLARLRHHLEPAALHWQESVPHHGNGAGAIKVRGDADELRTAIANILDNAIKYSGADVDVAVGIETPDPNRVVLRVRDRGVGIPARELKRIFKRFYRVPRSRSSSHAKGTGLGLFIVRAIARAHGGRVFAESAGEARGTTVTLELPRSAA